jgi:hypothetical protein
VSWEEITLDLGLDLPPPHDARRGAGEAKPRETTRAKIRWASYKVQDPVHCDACLKWVHEHWPHDTHAPNRAVLRRTIQGEHTYWCAEHGEAQKELDGVSRTTRTKR